MSFDLETTEREIVNGVDLNGVDVDCTAMYVAACASHWPVVLRLLAAGADPNAGRGGKYLLSRAAEAGENDVVKALLAAGADVNIGFHVNNAEHSPLIMAAWRKHWPVVQTLIAAGADVNDVAFDGSPLIWLAYRSGATDVLDALIDNPRTNLNATFRAPTVHGPETDMRIQRREIDKQHLYTLISNAAVRMDWPLVLRLAATGAKVDQFDGTDMSVLQLAAHAARDDVVKALLDAGADPNLANREGQTALHFAEGAPVVRTLVAAGAVVDAKDSHGYTAVTSMVEFDLVDVERLDALIEAGANINAVDNDGLSILERAVRQDNDGVAHALLERGAKFDWTKDDQASLWLAIVTGREDEVDRLVDKGIGLEKIAHSRSTPLTLAVYCGRASMVAKLLRLGACIGDGDGEAMYTAATEGQEDIVRLLIDAGVDVDVVGADDETAVAAAAQSEHWGVVTMLARAKYGLLDGNYALGLALSGGPSAQDAILALLDAGTTFEAALTDAVSAHDTKRVALLLAAGADATAALTRTLQFQSLLAAAGWQPPSNMTPGRLKKLHAAIPAAKKTIEHAGFAAIRGRVLEICVALQALHLPAPQLIEIVTHECEPFAAHLPYHYLWDAVVLVKHFHE